MRGRWLGIWGALWLGALGMLVGPVAASAATNAINKTKNQNAAMTTVATKETNNHSTNAATNSGKLSVAANARATTIPGEADPNAWALEDDASMEDNMDDDARFAAEHLLLSSRFAAPFMGERIYPRISVGTSLLFSQDGDGSALDQFEGQLNLSLYWVDLHIPFDHFLTGEERPTRVRLDIKVPIPVPIDSASRFALMAGATFSEEYPQLIDSLRFQVAWGYGGEYVSFQVRGGYGYRQPFAESAMKQGFLYGSTLGFNIGPVQPMVEVDGVRFDDLSGQFDVIPGIRFYPLDTPSLRFGLAALMTFTHDPGDSTVKRRRLGAIFQMSYDFI